MQNCSASRKIWLYIIFLAQLFKYITIRLPKFWGCLTKICRNIFNVPLYLIMRKSQTSKPQLKSQLLLS